MSITSGVICVQAWNSGSPSARSLSTSSQALRKATPSEPSEARACRYFSSLLVGALKGVNKETLLSAHYCPVEGLWERSPLAEKIAEIADGSFKHRDPPGCFFEDTSYLSEETRLSIKSESEGDSERIEGTGYVVKSLEAALWAFHKSQDFREGALLAVNLGDDADTTGAIYGQIGGAYYGVRTQWRSSRLDSFRLWKTRSRLWRRQYRNFHSRLPRLTGPNSPGVVLAVLPWYEIRQPGSLTNRN